MKYTPQLQRPCSVRGPQLQRDNNTSYGVSVEDSGLRACEGMQRRFVMQEESSNVNTQIKPIPNT
jgi:hypothetical protein